MTSVNTQKQQRSFLRGCAQVAVVVTACHWYPRTVYVATHHGRTRITHKAFQLLSEAFECLHDDLMQQVIRKIIFCLKSVSI